MGGGSGTHLHLGRLRQEDPDVSPSCSKIKLERAGENKFQSLALGPREVSSLLLFVAMKTRKLFSMSSGADGCGA